MVYGKSQFLFRFDEINGNSFAVDCESDIGHLAALFITVFILLEGYWVVLLRPVTLLV